MYNFIDANPTLFNLKAEPFYGYLVFLVPGTTTNYVNVFDVEGLNLGHIVTTNQYGRLAEQVMLDRTVDCQYWEFTGTLFNIEDSTQFTLIRTERIIDPAEVVDIKVDGAQTVGTIEALRDIDTTAYEENTTCFRMGYYTEGDHPPLAYRWVSSSTAADDGGYCIKPSNVTGAGRWLALFPDYIDVRWYGVKGAPLRSQVTYQSSAIIAATNKALAMGKTLYFASTGADTFYGCDNVNMNVGNADIRLDAKVRLVAKEGTSNSITCYNLYCDRDAQVFLQTDMDPFAVTAHEVWTASVSNYGLLTADIVHYNKNIRQSLWKNCTVKYEIAAPFDQSYDNCQLSFDDPSYKLRVDDKPYEFLNMEFTDSYFAEGSIEYGLVNVHDNCTVDIDNFVDAGNWFNLMMDWQAENVNCQGRHISATEVNCSTHLYDVDIDSLTINSGCTVSITRGRIGTLRFNDNTKNLTLSDVTVDSSAYIVANDVTMSACVVADGTVNSFTCDLDRSQLYCTLTIRDFVAGHCEFASTVAAATFNAVYSTFLGNISVLFIDKLSVYCVNNTIGANAYMLILRNTTSEYENVLAENCAWIGNRILNKNFWIGIDRTYLDPDDSKHSYVYKDNTGACVQPGDRMTLSMKYVDVSEGNDPLWGSGSPFILQQYYGEQHTGGKVAYICGSPFSQIFLFTIGTTNVSCELRVKLLGCQDTEWATMYTVTGSVALGNMLQAPEYTLRASTADQGVYITSGGSSSRYKKNLFTHVGGWLWKIDMGGATAAWDVLQFPLYMTIIPNNTLKISDTDNTRLLSYMDGTHDWYVEYRAEKI